MKIYRLKFEVIFIFIICLVSTLLFFENTNAIATEEKVLESKNKVILIDPGHGGFDGGAVSKSGTVEKGINLDIASKLKTQLENEGYTVHMTREEDISLDKGSGAVKNRKVQDLNKRCELKKETKCDMFLSIHLNMFTKPNSRGAQVWYSGFPESKKLAEEIQLSFKQNLAEDNNRQPKPALSQYKILRDKYEAPCLIIECGFLSNPQEERLLKSDEYQGKIAEAITKGVKSYYNTSNKE